MWTSCLAKAYSTSYELVANPSGYSTGILNGYSGTPTHAMYIPVRFPEHSLWKNTHFGRGFVPVCYKLSSNIIRVGRPVL